MCAVVLHAPTNGLYLVGQPVSCRMSLSPSFTVMARDWIGLFPASYSSLRDYLTFEWAIQAAVVENDDETGGKCTIYMHYIL